MKESVKYENYHENYCFVQFYTTLPTYRNFAPLFATLHRLSTLPYSIKADPICSDVSSGKVKENS